MNSFSLKVFLWWVLKSQATSEKTWLIIWPYLVFKEGRKVNAKERKLTGFKHLAVQNWKSCGYKTSKPNYRYCRITALKKISRS